MQVTSFGSSTAQPEYSGKKNTEKAEVLRQMERHFIKEMVKYSVPETDNGYFGGGIGEDQMRSFLVDEWAENIARSMSGKILRD